MSTTPSPARRDPSLWVQCANIALAPELSVLAIAVADCPPLALLLVVELLNRA
ncbi:hypothetical protein [Kutzneria kofuensis]|uniref:Uncharacterized protein n=1 Tax=Kutzneria kofuensis TaxID=103725 RepID=A0A7W9NIZ1_9PSEU|nr:hypothetical protein [Kutzneria kofuensis]MBB5893811.1 hypothetical protein [Kutzneria kofuensis]